MRSLVTLEKKIKSHGLRFRTMRLTKSPLVGFVGPGVDKFNSLNI